MLTTDKCNFHEFSVANNAGLVKFILPKRYVNVKLISAGAQGVVVKAEDTVTKQTFAIKKMTNPFFSTMTAKRTFREFVLLTTMKHANVINLESAFTPQQCSNNFNEIYFVMEYMNYNLAQVISKLKLDLKNLSYFTYQMIIGIKYMHRAGIIHRDLKPTNIVVNDKCILKILDFGLARKMETTERMSMYVVTRHYRAPEVILGLPYGEKVDVWAIGCILAEMILRRVFFAGSDRIDQWIKIVSTLGSSSKHFLNRLEPNTRKFVTSIGKVRTKSFKEIFTDDMLIGKYPNAPEINPDSVRDLLAKMLQIDPEQRISVDEAVQHPFIRIWFDESEWNASLPNGQYDFEDNLNRPLEEWRENLFNEIKQFESTHNIHG